MSLYYVEHFERVGFVDLVPRFVKWKRENAKGVHFSWFGMTFGWREENQDYLLNEVLKERKKRVSSRG